MKFHELLYKKKQPSTAFFYGWRRVTAVACRPVGLHTLQAPTELTRKSRVTGTDAARALRNTYYYYEP